MYLLLARLVAVGAMFLSHMLTCWHPETGRARPKGLPAGLRQNWGNRDLTQAGGWRGGGGFLPGPVQPPHPPPLGTAGCNTEDPDGHQQCSQVPWHSPG